MDTCMTCQSVRKALCSTASTGDMMTKGLIACAYWSCYQEHEVVQDENGDDRFFTNLPFDHAFATEGPTGKIYYKGWADLRALPDNEKGSGWHTNFCVLIHGTNCCKHYEKRRD